MRPPRSLLAGGVGIVVLLVGFNILQAGLLKVALKEDDALAARRLGKSLGDVLEHAHRLNDDLTLQETIQGVSQAPGVILACVLDPSHKVLAHTTPAELGQPFEHSRRSAARGTLWAFSLEEDKAPWGTLVISLSRHLAREKIVHQTVLLILLDLGLVVFFILMARRGWVWVAQLQKQLQEARDISREQSRDLDRLNRVQVITHALWTSWLQQAVERIPQPVLFLDNHQRVLASNAAGLQSLGVETLSHLQGKSWQEIPQLEAYGEALQRSLESVGQIIQVPAAVSDPPVQLLSHVSPVDTSPCTWVYL